MYWMMRSVVISASAPGVDRVAVAQDGDAVAHRAQLLQPMGNVDDAHAALPQRAHDAEDLLGFGAGERGGGLVEDQQAGAVLDGAADLHQLLAGGAELFHAPVGLERETVLLDEALRAFRACGGG